MNTAGDVPERVEDRADDDRFEWTLTGGELAVLRGGDIGDEEAPIRASLSVLSASAAALALTAPPCPRSSRSTTPTPRPSPPGGRWRPAAGCRRCGGTPSGATLRRAPAFGSVPAAVPGFSCFSALPRDWWSRAPAARGRLEAVVRCAGHRTTFTVGGRTDRVNAGCSAPGDPARSVVRCQLITGSGKQRFSSRRGGLARADNGPGGPRVPRSRRPRTDCVRGQLITGSGTTSCTRRGGCQTSATVAYEWLSGP